MARHGVTCSNAKRAGEITKEECSELDIYEAIEHIIIHTKAQVSRKIQQQAS